MSDHWCTDRNRLRVNIGVNDPRVHIKIDTNEYYVNISGENVNSFFVAFFAFGD